MGPEPLKHFDHDRAAGGAGVPRAHIQLLMVQASLRSIQMRFADAEERYRKVLDKDPNYYPALNNLAELLALQKIKLDEALQDVNRAIEVRGPEGAIVDTRASVYLAMGRTQDAIRELEKALAGPRRAGAALPPGRGLSCQSASGAGQDHVRKGGQERPHQGLAAPAGSRRL